MAELSLFQIAGINGPTYEEFYKEQKLNPNGEIAAADVAPFLKKFGLTDAVLSKIWTIADTKQRGFLSKEEFFLALKLIALVQNNLEPSMANATMIAPAPKLAVNNANLSPAFGLSTHSITNTFPNIPPDEVKRYQTAFEKMFPVAGKITGQQAKAMLMQTNLPIDVLSKLWDLADIDKDGCFDLEEFIVAMQLVRRCQEGEALPPTLPASLLQNSQKLSLLQNRPIPDVEGLMMRNLTSWNNVAPGVAGIVGNIPDYWVVTSEERSKYDPLFYTADLDHDGFVTGLEAKDIFVRSGLSQQVLAQIWALVDIKSVGKLNVEQFALAMHFIHQQAQVGLDGKAPDLPTTLPPHMVPPSLRAEMNALKPLSLTDFGITPESDRVYAEVEAIRKEREEVERACNQLDLQIAQRVSEVAAIQRAAEQAQGSRQVLEQQKVEAEAKLNEYRQRKQAMEETLSELRASIVQEKKALEELRTQLASQHSAMRDQEAEAERLRSELIELQREESSVQEKINANRRRLQAIDAENKHCSNQVEQSQKYLMQMESTKSEIQKLLDQLKAASDNPDSGLPEPDLEHAKALTSSSPTTVGSADGAFSSSLEDIGLANAAPKKETNGHLDGNFPPSAAFAVPIEDPFAANDPFWSNKADPFADPFFSNAASAAKPAKVDENAFSAFDDFFIKPVPATGAPPSLDPFEAAFGDNFGSSTGFGPDPFESAFGDPAATKNDPFSSTPFTAPSIAPPRPTQGPPPRGEKTTSSFPADFDPFGGTANSFTLDSKEAQSRGKDKDSSGKHRYQHHGTTRRNSGGASTATVAGMVSETDQLRWAKEESERLAKVEAEARRREEEELQLAIKLSQMESKKQQKRK